MRGLVPAVLVSLVLACGENVLPPAPPGPPPPPPPPPAPVAAALTIVSGNSQLGWVGELLGQPLVVRVTSTEGTGVASVAVRWSIVSGAAEFGIPMSDTYLTYTGGDGRTSISMRPTAPGRITVSATADAVQGSSATFTIEVPEVVPASRVLIRFGPIFDCYGTPSPMDPSVFQAPEGTIAAGALVEWEYAASLPAVCGARLRSVSVPLGGVPFDSGIIGPGQRWGVILGAVGDWVVTDVLNGGSVTVRVVASPGNPPPPPPPPPPPLPLPQSAVGIVSGNNQNGSTGTFMAQPFVVRVTDAEGYGISGIRVTWTVLSGTGEFPGPGFAPQATTQTGVDGTTSTLFRPNSSGTLSVNARAAGFQGSGATFTVAAGGALVVVIPFGPASTDCTGLFDDPSSAFAPTGTIPVETVVEWEYQWNLASGCRARISSSSVPPGGLPFDSGVLAPGRRFRISFGVAGDWEVKDLVNGGTMTLRVR